MTSGPAEIWHVGHFIAEEMAERGWSATDLAALMGGRDHKERIIDELIVMAICGEIALPDDDDCRIDQVVADKLAKAFGTSAELFINLDRAWVEGGARGAIRHRY